MDEKKKGQAGVQESRRETGSEEWRERGEGREFVERTSRERG